MSSPSASSVTGATFLVCAVAGLIGLLGFSLTPAAHANADLTQATEALRASIQEWKREDASYRAIRDKEKIAAAEQEAYAAYLAGLRLRVFEQCEVVRQLGGEAAIAPFECVRIGPEEKQLSPAAVVPPTAVLTDEEKKAAIQARLTGIEGEIDESLRKRQEEIRQTAAASGAAGNGGSGGGSSAGGGASSGRAGGASASASSESRRPGGSPEVDAARKAGGSKGAATVGAARPDSPAGRPGGAAAPRQRPTDGRVDDDIVARQLREAAEKETDPVLREKLWAEYRKYKEARR